MIKLKRFVGYRSRFYWQGTVSRPSLLLVAICRVEKCSATGAKRSSYRTCLTLREKVVYRKCCRKLIKKSVIVKRILLYLFNYWFNTGINLLGNQVVVVTEEIALSSLNLSLFLWTFARSESYIKKWHWSTHKVRESFWAVVLANFKHCFDLTIIKIIPLYNTVNTIVFESRETLWIALYLSLFRETLLLLGTVVAFKNVNCSCKMGCYTWIFCCNLQCICCVASCKKNCFV